MNTTVDQLLHEAAGQRASDVHFEPTAQGYEIKFRVDGLLQPIARCDAADGRSLVSRLMVLAHLLTYRLDIPQEGRLTLEASAASDQRALELRVSVMPTTHGLRAAVRMPADLVQPRTLEALDLPPCVYDGLVHFAAADSGMLVLTGPAGSGKTTTIYALLQHLVEHASGQSIVALEDPVERDLAGVTQIEVRPHGELTYDRALRSILRQDPQVLVLGEIRDAATASLAIQAALSGHRLICTLHAADAAGAVNRLLEMGCEAHQVASALFGVVAQRLLRRRNGAGYHGRVPTAEFVRLDETLRRAILRRADAQTLRQAYRGQATYRSLRAWAAELAARGVTDNVEVSRVLGNEE